MCRVLTLLSRYLFSHPSASVAQQYTPSPALYLIIRLTLYLKTPAQKRELLRASRYFPPLSPQPQLIVPSSTSELRGI